MTLFSELLMKFSAASLKLFLAAASNRCEPRVPFRLQIGCLKLIDFFYIYSLRFFSISNKKRFDFKGTNFIDNQLFSILTSFLY